MFYGHCIGMGGIVQDWAALVRLHLPDDPDLRWNATRRVVASMHILLYMLNEGSGVDDHEWEQIRSRHLLTSGEVAKLKAQPRGTVARFFLPLVWALGDIEAALARSSLSPPAHASLSAAFRSLAFDFRGHCGQIVNWLNQPVPFPYYQFLTLLLVVDLLMVSYWLVTMDFSPALTFSVYFLISTSFLGLREAAIAMTDPFGTDDIDFDVEGMLFGAYSAAVACLKDGGVSAEPLDIKNPVRAPRQHAVVRTPAATRRPSRLSQSPC
jgi:hypothetical protein